MALADQFEKLLSRELKLHAAWMPVVSPFELGDYGDLSDGVFQKLGNIRDEFNVDFKVGKGKDTAFDLVSEKTVTIDVSGGAQVNIAPDTPLKAGVTYKFEQANSFLVKAPIINVSVIENVNQVANKLKDREGWKKRSIVVYQVYEAQNPLIIGTNEGGTEVTVTADASGLQKFNVGTAESKFGLKTNKKLGLELKGESGVIALGLFKVRFIGGGGNVLEKAGESDDTDPDGTAFEDLNEKDLQQAANESR